MKIPVLVIDTLVRLRSRFFPVDCDSASAASHGNTDRVFPCGHMAAVRAEPSPDRKCWLQERKERERPTREPPSPHPRQKETHEGRTEK